MRIHADEVALETVQVDRLVAHARPDLSGLPIRELPGAGTTSRVFRIGRTHLARFPMQGTDPDSVRMALRAEHEAMEGFARVSPVPSPAPEAIGEPGEGFPLPWSLQTWVDGQIATPHAHAGSVAFAADLAALVADLRAADTNGRTFKGTNRGGHLPDHDDWVEECLRHSEGLLPVGELAHLWKELRALPREDPDVMCHGDLIPSNLLVASDRLVGVLDTGRFGPADPALDLIAAWHLLDAGPRDVLRENLAVTDLQWERGAAWALEQALGLVWYYRETLPVMAELGRTTLARLLSKR